MLQYSQLSGVIFLVDCGEGMLFKHNLGEESNFERCIKCIRSVCQKKVISSEKDMLAVVFYGMLVRCCLLFLYKLSYTLNGAICMHCF